jgi:hypothetical protein
MLLRTPRDRAISGTKKPAVNNLAAIYHSPIASAKIISEEPEKFCLKPIFYPLFPILKLISSRK